MINGDRVRETIGEWSARQDRPLELELSVTEHPRTGPLRAFCRVLAEACGTVRVSETEPAGDDLPALRLRRGAILYRAAPAGTELEPFLEALAAEAVGAAAAGPRFRPAWLRIHVAAACPHCPAAVRALLPLAAAGGPLTLEVVDSEACRDLAEADKVRSVPTLILDRTFRWTGTIRPGDLEELLAPGNRGGIGAGVLERLLENGNAGPLAAMMIEEGEASPALCRLLASDAMSVRLGAMLVAEELLERAPELVEPLIPRLWERFAEAAEPARGDMLYIIGEAGPPSMAAKINALLGAGLHPEVEEAAREALERLAERHR